MVDALHLHVTEVAHVNDLVKTPSARRHRANRLTGRVLQLLAVAQRDGIADQGARAIPQFDPCRYCWSVGQLFRV